MKPGRPSQKTSSFQHLGLFLFRGLFSFFFFGGGLSRGLATGFCFVHLVRCASQDIGMHLSAFYACAACKEDRSTLALLLGNPLRVPQASGACPIGPTLLNVPAGSRRCRAQASGSSFKPCALDAPGPVIAEPFPHRIFLSL